LKIVVVFKPFCKKNHDELTTSKTDNISDAMIDLNNVIFVYEKNVKIRMKRYLVWTRGGSGRACL